MTEVKEEDKKDEPVTEIVAIESIYGELVDPEMEGKVNEAVGKILLLDDRFHNADIEVIDALRDWVRAEAVLARAYTKFMTGDTTASTERMFRHAALHKNTLRDELFGKFKGRKAKKEEVDFANKILVESGVIEPGTEVDILADPKT